MSSVSTLLHSRPSALERPVRLLVADDSKVARERATSLLRELDYVEVQAVCENGRLAVEAALRHEPDVVLLDLQMPVMSGLEAAEIFRTSMPHVGVILTSAHDSLEVREVCLAGGADAFLGKDLLNTHLAAVLDSVLERTRAPERHRRGSHLVIDVDAPPSRRPLTDLFSPARPFAAPRAHTSAHPPRRDPLPSRSAIG